MPKSDSSSNRREDEAAQGAQLRARLRENLGDWAEMVLAPSGLRPARHHQRLIEALEATVAAKSGRLIVNMPPGAAKSTYSSVLFPAWWLARRPEGLLIAASHTRQLAEHFGRQVRGLLEEHSSRLGCRVRPDQRAARQFATETGSQYYGTGVLGPIVGRRADLVLIDDPVRSQAEADSSVARERLWDWFRADLVSRLRPGGAIVLVMTRWHPDDLVGRLAAAEGWQVLRLPALAEADDPLGRPAGSALWPEWEDEAALLDKRRAVGERSWEALYQQRPRLRRGGMFAAARMPVLAPEDAERLVGDSERVRAWDLASAAAEAGADPDWTVGVKLARAPDGSFVVLDVTRLRDEPAAVETAVRDVAARDGPGVAIGLPQDPGQAGRAQVVHLVRQLAGFRVRTSPESGSKEARAEPVATQVNAGTISLARAAWNAALVEELEAFPLGSKDDQVDALSRAFAMLARSAAVPLRRAMPLLAR